MATWNIHINSYVSPICGWRGNPKCEYRNSKQIQMTKITMTKTRNGHIMKFLFRIFKIRISIFVFFKVVPVIWWHDKLPKSGQNLWDTVLLVCFKSFVHYFGNSKHPIISTRFFKLFHVRLHDNLYPFDSRHHPM